MANFTAWTCTLGSDAVSDWTAPLALARQACQAQPDSLQFQNTLGTLLFRAGQIEEAESVLEAVAAKLAETSAESKTSPAYTWFALALVQHAAGDPDKAKTWFEKAKAETTRLLAESPQDAPPLAWNRRLTLELFQRDAESSMADETPPASKAAQPGG